MYVIRHICIYVLVTSGKHICTIIKSFNLELFIKKAFNDINRFLYLRVLEWKIYQEKNKKAITI